MQARIFSLSSSAVDFGVVGKGVTATRTIKFTNLSAGTLGFQITVDQPWVKVQMGQQSGSDMSILLSVDSRQLSSGKHSAVLEVTAGGQTERMTITASAAGVSKSSGTAPSQVPGLMPLQPQASLPWWRRCAAPTVASLPSGAQALLAVGVRWAIGGAVVGSLVGFSAMNGSHGFFRKILVLGLWVFAGSFMGASFKWGQIGSVSGGGVKALDHVVRIGNFPLQILGKVFKKARGFTDLAAELNRVLARFLGNLSAGCPYLLYVCLTGRTQLDAALYVAFVIVGGVLGLMGVGLLIWLGSPGK